MIRPLIFLSTCLVTVALVGDHYRAAQGDRLPVPYTDFNFDKPRLKPDSEHLFREVGHVIKVFVIRPSEKDPAALQTLKVEIAGDSVTNLGVVLIPVRVKTKDGEAVDKSRNELAVFLQTAKKGNAKIKITPIRQDGKIEPPKEWTFKVIIDPDGANK